MSFSWLHFYATLKCTLGQRATDRRSPLGGNQTGKLSQLVNCLDVTILCLRSSVHQLNLLALDHSFSLIAAGQLKNSKVQVKVLGGLLWLVFSDLLKANV